MKKRAIALITVFCFMFSGVAFKLLTVANPKGIYASKNSSVRVKEIANLRGRIYDRNLKKLVNNEDETYLIIKPSPTVVNKIEKISDKEKVLDELKTGEMSISKQENCDIKTDSDILNLKVPKRYSGSTLCHIIGYTDENGDGICGIEKSYNEFLKENEGSVSAVFKTDALGRVLLGEDTEIRYDNFDESPGVVLTIDRDIQKITEEALKNGGIKKGAAVVLKADTCEILACASLPVFDLEHPEKSIESKDSPFINRAFLPYSVGSVFKVVTAAAAIENGVLQSDFICTGKTEKSGVTFNCNKKAGHGSLDMEKALSVSCNPYFIELAAKVGAKNMLLYAEKFKFDKDFDLDGITCESGNLPELFELNSEAAVGNFGFGQGDLLATPLHIALCYASLANGGIYKEPSLVIGNLNESGTLEKLPQKGSYRILEEKTAETINAYLAKTVLEGTGMGAYSPYFTSCGKTATAETGQKNANGKQVLNSWFAGFFPLENPEYVVCILKEDGASGSGDDAPIFKEISENIYFLKNGTAQS